MAARVHALIGDSESEILEFKDLSINLKTYEAKAGDVLLDLTFMEYELLKFFVVNQENVWSREQLLEKVWGYDYFGGARTVDVHVRRLRAKLGDKRDNWIKKSNYFHSEDLLMLKEIIPESSNVLEIGCGNGQLIGRLNVKGVGIDLSEKLINKAKKSYPRLKFYVGDINNSSKLLKNEKKFDYIIITDTVGYFQDVQKTLESLHFYCNEETRIVISYFSPLWQPILSLATFLKLKMPDLNPPLFACL